MTERVKIVECPRDAWQGLSQVIPTQEKVAYLRGLIEAGFRHLDAVSFVSPKHVPQMADSEAVLAALRDAGALGEGSVEIIGIVVNERGLERALAAPGVTTIGYPHSISDRFLQQNANLTQAASRALVETLQQVTTAAGRALVVYVSMAFGNPYGDPWEEAMVRDTVAWLKAIGVRSVSLADTVGTADPERVAQVFRAARAAALEIEIGVHLHSRPTGVAQKVLAAYQAGCRRFDSALTGLGGCPFAGDELVGNIATEILVPTLVKQSAESVLAAVAVESALPLARQFAARYAVGAAAG